MRASISGFAPTYALELQQLNHSAIRDASQGQSSEFLAMVERQQQWLQLNPAARDVYTMRRAANGTVQMIVDAETDHDRNGKIEGDRESRTEIGEVYVKITEAMTQAFDGRSGFDDLPFQDRWGLWVSAYAPIHNPDGTVDAIVGVDFSARDWVKDILIARLAVLLIACAVILGFLGSVSHYATMSHQLTLKHEHSIQLQEQTQSLQAANRELSLALDSAVQASRAKSDFLANMSHEIRTPMNGIMGLTEHILNTRLECEQRRNLELIQSSADALMTVLNDILDFSKIEANKMTLDPQPFDLREMLGDALKLFGLRAHQQQVELAFRISPEVPNIVIGDAGRIRQILINLVGNAIKFTHHGEVVISVNMVRFREQDCRLRIEVRDSGIGIEKSTLKRIVEPFNQADNSTTRKYGGTGLGLTICRRLIELMGGQMELDSTPGVGTTVTVELDCERPGKSIAATIAEEHINLDQVRILVVDDNSTNRLSLRELLNSWQVQSTVLDSGCEVVQTLEAAIDENNPFDLVLLDLQMPEMDGFETTQNIRRSEKAKQTRVVMLSSCDASAFAEQVRDLGLSAYLTKPVKQSELLESILTVLNWPGQNSFQRTRSRFSEQQRRLQAMTSCLPPLKILVAEDNFVNQQLLQRVLSKAGHEVLMANHGREAVNLLETNKVDIVLMDVQMPYLDGYQATVEIREAERQSRSGGPVPIIALTANAMRGDRERCFEAGMDDYASKPIQFAKLLEVIAGLIPQSMLHQGSEYHSTSPENTAIVTTDLISDPQIGCTPILSRDELRDRIEGDLDLLAMLFEAFDGDVDRQLSKLHLQIDARNWHEARKIAHTIKGTAGNLGGIRVARFAAEIERQLCENQPPAPSVLFSLEQSANELCAELREAIAQKNL
jgi:signal transduction histidine kinase/DNA-binding response OmpR family regulator